MLKPQANETRELVNLDGLYRFKVDFDRSGHRDEWFKAALDSPLEMGVPASYNDVFPDKAIRDHVGYVWYQREVRVPRGWAGERIHLRLDSATHEGMVWVDDALVAQHAGGYMPFSADITDHVTPGQAFRLTVSVNNELTQATIPPGSITVTEDGRRQQSYLHDFYNYAGLHRSLWLFSTPAVTVDDITVVTGFDGTTGSVDYTIATAGGTGSETVTVSLKDADGVEVARADGARGTLSDRRRRALEARRRVPLQPDRRDPRRRRGCWTATPCPSASGRSKSAARNSSSTGSRSTSPASACTRTTSPSARATATPRWSTISSSWTGWAPTRSGPRTTPTPKRSWSSRTATGLS